MAGFLFHNIVFGPVMSRRLGVSLGINLLPPDKKVCSFNCIYCECGWTDCIPVKNTNFYSLSEIHHALEERFRELHDEHVIPDAITFAGNGEPTLYPEFGRIMEEIIILRDSYLPGAKITVLSNATTLDDPEVFSALQKADKSIMKLDAGNDALQLLINQPLVPYSREGIIRNLMKFKGEVIVQSLFLKGEYKGKSMDNTGDAATMSWIEELKRINPQYVMIYPIARETPAQGLLKVPMPELEHIAEKVEKAGIKARVYP